MRTSLPVAATLLALLVGATGPAACARQEAAAPAADPAAPTAAAASPSAALAGGCLAAGDGALQAALRGALVADLDWRNADMQCEGGPRPDGQGLRIAIAGPLPPAADAPAGAPGRRVRFIFGIDLRDRADGSAQVLPVNLTVILEGAQQLFATRGDDKCAIETLERTPLAQGGGTRDRVVARGYCTGPASDLAGTARLHVPTFAFTAVMDRGAAP